MAKELEALPTCDSCGATLELRAGYDPKIRGNGATYEQRWCGVWYDHPPLVGGGSMVGHTVDALYMSDALKEMYACGNRNGSHL